MAGPQDPAAAGRDQLRAGHADREQVVETLKDAFVHGRLTRDELDTRAGLALSARTRADLAALTADIPAVPSAPAPAPATATAGLARLPSPARRWPLARAAAKSGGCLGLAFALVLFAANVLDPHGLGNPYHPWSSLCALVAMGLVLAALGIFATGVATSVEQRRSRRQLPPRTGPGGHALEAGQSSATGHGPALPPDRPAPTRVDLRSDSSRPGRPHSSRRGARAPRGIRPVPDAG
ncbi:MAG: DUF1707 SHOCT-like domain-containing protein [Streptosporangiaceae bacterium]